jgi:hypothetical protein
MQSIIFACAGAGVTNVSEPLVAMGQDPQNFSYHFGLVAYAGVVVYDDSYIMVVPNMLYNGVLSGGNTKLISRTVADSLKNKNFRYQMDNMSRPSVYVVSVPWDTLKRNRLHNLGFIDITGHSETDPDGTPIHYPSAQFYAIKYGWNKLTQMTYSITGPIQPIARIGLQSNVWLVNHTGTGMIEIPGQGHHGMYEESGHRVVRTMGLNRFPRLSIN